MPQAIKSSITVEDYGPYLRFRKWQQSSKGYIYKTAQWVYHSADTTLELYLSKTTFGDKNTVKQFCDTVGPLEMTISLKSSFSFVNNVCRKDFSCLHVVVYLFYYL